MKKLIQEEDEKLVMSGKSSEIKAGVVAFIPMLVALVLAVASPHKVISLIILAFGFVGTIILLFFQKGKIKHPLSFFVD